MAAADIEHAGKDKTVIADEYEGCATESSKTSIGVGQDQLAGVTPPHESYEGYHRFDPLASWTAKEERAVVLKTDILLLSWVCVMVCSFVQQYIDKLWLIKENSSLDCS